MLVSAFAFGGIPEKAVKKAFAEADIYVSPDLLKEYCNVPLVLESEGKIDHIQLKALISGIASFIAKAQIVYPVKKLSVCRDVGDNMLFECCFKAGANVLLTGDSDILDVKDLPFDLKILTPQKFIEGF